MKLGGTIALGLAAAALASGAAQAHKLRERALAVQVADEGFVVTPSQDWNRLDGNAGKRTESWTLDGAQLNDLTFYGGIEPGKPLVRERNKKSDPLPKFTTSTLPVEIPELVEGTYRTVKNIANFEVTATEPARFLGSDGISFSYQYLDGEHLVRKGEARAAIIDGKLYMMTFDAPRLRYFDQSIAEFRRIADSAKRS